MVRYDETPPFPQTKNAAIAIPVDFLRIVFYRIIKNRKIRIWTKKIPGTYYHYAYRILKEKREGKRF
jgi:hypothetical protein